MPFFSRLAIFLLCLFISESLSGSQLFQNITVKQHNLPDKYVTAFAQDHHGSIWIGTANGFGKFDGYKVTNFSEIDGYDLSKLFVTDITIGQNNTLWVSTRDSGLYRISLKQTINNRVTHFFKNKEIRINGTAIYGDTAWLATDRGLWESKIDSDDIEPIPYPSIALTDSVNDLKIIDDSLFITTHKQILKLSLSNDSIENISGINTNQTQYDNLELDVESNILWYTSNEYLKGINLNTGGNVQTPDYIANIRIRDFSIRKNAFWLATYEQGMIWYKSQTEVKHYLPKPDKTSSIADNFTTTFFIDNSQTAWLGTFHGGANIFSLNSLNVDLFDQFNISCLKNRNVYFTYKENHSFLFGTTNGVVKHIPHLKTCEIIDYNNTSTKTYVFSSFKDKNNVHYFGTNKGLAHLGPNNQLVPVLHEQLAKSIYFIKPYTNDSLLFGTYHGIYKLDKNQTIKQIDPNSKYSQRTIHQAFKINNYWLLSTSLGLAKLSHSKITPFFDEITHPLNQNVSALFANNEHFFITLQNNILYQYTHTGLLINTFNLTKDNRPISVNSINQDHENNLWVTTTLGLYKINIKTGKLLLFNESDGITNEFFTQRANNYLSDGKLYLGGKNVVSSFYPKSISNNNFSPKALLTEFSLFNRKLNPGDESNNFELKKPIAYYKKIELNHKNYLFGFEFSSSAYSDSNNVKFAYSLVGLHDDWVYTTANNRQVTFNNLSPGQYTFKVKAANKNETWSKRDQEVALTIIIHPAPWKTWWAYLLYLSILLICLYSFIQYRLRTEKQRASKLEKEVTQRTKEINQQKNTIEKLMQRKDEFFANLSHEFRTPLTLILGPLEKELNSKKPKDHNRLHLIQRNAQRLKGMVEQILKLIELRNETVEEKFSQSVNLLLKNIVNSFIPVAEEKNIYLELEQNVICNSLLEKDALDIIIGNLLSNAIKYTPEGGNISVQSISTEKTVKIKVSDTGLGMNKQECQDIFDRFVRLDRTSDIAGTGIGLSIVKTLVDRHAGTLEVNSKEKRGTTFTINLPITDEASKYNQYSTTAIQHLTSVTNEPSTSLEFNDVTNEQTAKELVLVIDDSKDMLDYVSSLLENDYQCLTSKRGDSGIQLAINHLPDLIICDVMMPGKDGYTVTKELRKNPLTSHIPIILLTAKGDKKSRVKGWNENIDDYMTKPFDESELKSRVSNIISVRNILRQKFSASFQNNLAQIKNIEKPDVIELNKIEQKFVDKFMRAIEKNYSNPKLNKIELASKMAVSDRQLQRKLKSLINQNPMDILRDYRLKKAAVFLKDGEQVNLVSDKCGFNSSSHFIKTFKAKYSCTPKKYQTND